MELVENLTPALVVTEPAAIAVTEDEDYRWLTDRLDAHSASVANLQTELLSRLTGVETSLQTNQEQSRLVIENQTRMIETLTSNLTALSESALLKLSQSVLESSSQTVEPEPEAIAQTVEIVEPIRVAEENPEPKTKAEKKRRRM